MRGIQYFIQWTMIFGLSGFAFAKDVQVLSTVDRNQVALGETFTYTISVSSSGGVQSEAPRVGDLEDLDLINSWTGQQTQSTFQNGAFQVRNTKTYNFMLAPKKAGEIKIPAAQIVVEGVNHTTEPITITASRDGGGANNQAQQDPNSDPMMDQMDQVDQMFNQLLQRRFGGGALPPGVNPRALQDQAPINPNEAFFIRAEADKDKAYVGEQVTASWYIYTRGQITDIDTLKYPTLKGFWKEELDMATRLNFEQAVVNGIPYQRARLVSYALFPISSGKASIDSYTAKCTVITSGNFGFGRPYQFTKASRPLALEVIDIPKENRPKDFTGAVGDFKVSAEVDRTSVPAHQPVTWKIKFFGRGNAKLIDLPAFELPPSVELYDQKSDSNFSKDGTSYKEFEVLLIPREEGKIQLPALTVSVFNPSTKSFEKISAKAITLEVTPGERAGGMPSLAGEGSSAPNKAESSTSKASLPFFTTPQTESATTLPSPYVLGGAFSLTLLSFLVHGFFALGRTRKKETLEKILKNRSRKVEGLIQKKDWRRAGAEMSNCCYFILGKVADEASANPDLKSLMKAIPPSLRQEHGEALTQLISDVEVLAFAPEEVSKPLSEPKKLQGIFNEFQRLMKASIQRLND